jgi:hypothetical protein
MSRHNVTNNGIINIAPKGSFVQEDNFAKVLGTGTFTTKIETTSLIDQSRFTYFSSPVSNTTLNAFDAWASPNQLYSFDIATQDWQQESATNPMQKGLGYAIAADNSNIFPFNAITDFNGAFNTGFIEQPTVFNAGGTDDDNNLIGNPYPSAIDATKLFVENPHLGTLYFWTHESQFNGTNYVLDDYATWNLSGGIIAESGGTEPTGFIASGQGFFAETTANGNGKVTFNNAMRVTDNNTDFRNAQPKDKNDKLWLNMYNDDGIFNQILIAFLPNGTINIDNSYDGKRNNANTTLNFYSLDNQQEHLAIQALPLFREEMMVPLGFTVQDQTVSHLKISLDHIEKLKDVTVILKDNVLDIEHNLSKNNYVFNTNDIGEVTNRFEIIFNKNALATTNLENLNTALVVYNKQENIIIKTSDSSIMQKIKIYDVLGKELYKNLKNTTNQINIKNIFIQGGIYFTTVELENGVRLRKKFINLK